MSIQYFEHPLAQGISTLGSAIGKGIETYGKRKYELNQQQQKRQLQFQQMGALSDANQVAIETEGDGFAKVGAFQQSIKDSGVYIDPANYIAYSKLIGDLSTKQQKEAQRDPVERQTHKENTKLVGQLSNQSRTAQGLLNQVPTIRKAIESEDISGESLIVGGGKRLKRKIFGGTPAAEQTLITSAKHALLTLGEGKNMRIGANMKDFLLSGIWDPKKSKEANLAALDFYEQQLNHMVNYPKELEGLLDENPDAMYDPTLDLRITNQYENFNPESGSSNMQNGELNPIDFAELVRKRGKKKK